MGMRKWLFVAVAAAVIVAVVAMVWPRGGTDVPYTSQEMTNAELECDAETLREALIGTATREEEAQAVEKTFRTSNTDCLREKLPELSDEQLGRLDSLISETRDREFEESVDE